VLQKTTKDKVCEIAPTTVREYLAHGTCGGIFDQESEEPRIDAHTRDADYGDHGYGCALDELSRVRAPAITE
jgi:hypothetical protein